MNITHVIESSGGSADFVLYLIKYLPSHKHTVVYSSRTFGSRLAEITKEFSATQFIYWKYAQREVKLFSDVKATVALYRVLRDIPADVIHVHSSKAGFLGRLVSFLLGKQNVIYTPNGLSHLRLDVSLVRRRIFILLEKMAYHLSGKIISCSKSEADEMIKNGMQSQFINNGTTVLDDQDDWNDNKSGKMLIATTGRATIQKNPALFNEIAKYFENDSRYEFLWIGGGELEHELNSTNIKITGWVEHDQVIDLLRQAHLYISTASWEGLPFAVVEAMSISKPLLLSHCVGNVDLVEDNYNGFIYRTASEAISKIEILYKAPDKRNQYGSNSRALAKEKFNVEKMAAAYEVAYKGFLKNKV